MPYSILTDVEWGHILNRVRGNLCVPFLGAGASLSHGQEQGLPTGATLSKELAKECGFPGDEQDQKDLLRVAQYYAFQIDPYALYTSVSKKLATANLKPGFLHRTFASMPFSSVLTTNFDDLMERAFRDAGKQPKVVMYQRHADASELELGTIACPLVYKLHGSLEEPSSLIVMEDDVIDFLACLLLDDPPLPKSIRALFKENSILFMGYGLRDWNIRALMRALRGDRRFGSPTIASFAVQQRPQEDNLLKEWEASVMYWRTSENLRCFDIDAVEFAAELQRRFEAGEGR
jgi:hypothetical protein